MDASTPIIQLRNLGPACERDLHAIDVFTLGDILELGVEETFRLMALTRLAQGEKKGVIHAAYLYALWGAVHDVDWQDIPEEVKQRFKEFAAEMRQEKLVVAAPVKSLSPSGRIDPRKRDPRAGA
jgi:DNA transformation protein and related proteins